MWQHGARCADVAGTGVHICADVAGVDWGKASPNAEPQPMLTCAHCFCHRFYKLTCSGVDTDAARAARAFKAVAVSWREQEQQVSTLFVTLELIDFLYIGCLWLATQDMTAPCVAALLAGAVDRHFMWLGVGGDGGGRSGRSSKTNALSSSSSSRGGGGGSNSGNSGGGGGGGPSSSSSSTRRE
jgi:hypothetical protein